MTGAPNDLIPQRNEPAPDMAARSEKKQIGKVALGNIIKKRVVLEKVWNLILFNYGMVFVIVILEGFAPFDFNLDSLVLVTLIGSVMGSSAVYVIKRSVDFAHSGESVRL